ncbi:MAG TPA: DUF1059 domain-containing protein [Candidatus Nanoarchaeia archaeon]|nr:DUF1059 domain-containing protein [Candidatus Nanoarchaeia archaeon]
MKTWVKFFIITLILGIPALILGPIIWAPSPDIHVTSSQFPFFAFIALVEALLFGFGVAFLIYILPIVKKKSDKSTWWAFISLVWLLVSWWPHDNSHIHNGFDPAGLLIIDLTFHLTIILASLILTFYFIKSIGGIKMGKRKVADCRLMPSEKNCSLTVAGTEDEVMKVSVRHAVEEHGHTDSKELRKQIKSMLKDE